MDESDIENSEDYSDIVAISYNSEKEMSKEIEDIMELT
jgi:hypothetical protein